MRGVFKVQEAVLVPLDLIVLRIFGHGGSSNLLSATGFPCYTFVDFGRVEWHFWSVLDLGLWFARRHVELYLLRWESREERWLWIRLKKLRC